MGNLLNINNKDIDFEKIELEIEENMTERKEKFNEYDKDIADFQITDERIGKDDLDYDCEAFTSKGDDLEYDHDGAVKEDDVTKGISPLFNLTPYCDIKISRHISSHRRIIGPALIKMRQILDEEIRRSLDPVINKQIEFNKKVNEYFEGYIFGKLNTQQRDFQKRIEGVSNHTGYLLARRKEIERLLKKIIEQLCLNTKEISRLKRDLAKKNGN